MKNTDSVVDSKFNVNQLSDLKAKQPFWQLMETTTNSIQDNWYN